MSKAYVAAGRYTGRWLPRAHDFDGAVVKTRRSTRRFALSLPEGDHAEPGMRMTAVRVAHGLRVGVFALGNTRRNPCGIVRDGYQFLLQCGWTSVCGSNPRRRFDLRAQGNGQETGS